MITLHSINMRKAIVIKDKNNFQGTIAYSLLSTSCDFRDFNDDLNEYDLLIVFYNKLPPKLNTKALIGWWMNDFRLPVEIDNGLEYNFDFIFNACGGVLSEYQQYFNKPTFYMPQCGIDTDKFSKSKRLINWDVLFLGGISHPKYHIWRKPYIDFLQRNYNFKIISDEKNSKDQKKLYETTKINLSISLGLQLTTSNRLYNILSSGGFALVYKFPDIEKIFENHKHLVYFSNIEEMKQLIDYYLIEEDKRKIIAKNGLELYQQKHTAKKRIGNMFDIMENKTTDFYGFI